MLILFTNGAFQLNSYDNEIYLYADDAEIIFSADNDVDLHLLVNNFFSQYSNRCTLNCLVVNTVKSIFSLLNSANISVSINGHMLNNPDFVKYLGIHSDNSLYWNYQVKHVT